MGPTPPHQPEKPPPNTRRFPPNQHGYPAKHGLSSPTDIIAYVHDFVYVIGLCYRSVVVYVIGFSVGMLSILCVYVIGFFRITNIEFQVQNIDSQL